MAAKENHGNDIYVAKKLRDDGNEEEENTGSEAALFGESIFRSRGDAKDDRIESEDIYVEFG